MHYRICLGTMFTDQWLVCLPGLVWLLCHGLIVDTSYNPAQRCRLLIYYIPEKRKFSGIWWFSSVTQPPRGPPPPPSPPPHNFVSAITFEGFKLRSSNLTHALLIQISRMSSIIDIVVPSKMAASGHFVKKFKKNGRSIWNGQKCDPKWFSDIQNGRRKKLILYQSEMARIAIESEFRKSQMADRSEMARNVMESEFRTSKMAAGSHFVKNFQKN